MVNLGQTGQTCLSLISSCNFVDLFEAGMPELFELSFSLPTADRRNRITLTPDLGGDTTL